MTAFDTAAQGAAAALGVTICAGLRRRRLFRRRDRRARTTSISPPPRPTFSPAGARTCRAPTALSPVKPPGTTATRRRKRRRLPARSSPCPLGRPAPKSRPRPSRPRRAGRSRRRRPQHRLQRSSVDGQKLVIGGTSAAVAPLWSGLIALLNQKLSVSRWAFFQPMLYALPTADKAFRDITSGNNGAYSAGTGWDPVTGLGSPNGTNMAAALVVLIDSRARVNRRKAGRLLHGGGHYLDAGGRAIR